MKKGILLIAFGKRGYGYMAYNLALSLRETNPDIPIAIAHDGVMDYCRDDWRKKFTEIIPLEKRHLSKGPGYTKMCVYELSPFDTTLYLDVDAVAIRDISECFDQDKPFACEVHGEGRLNDKIEYAIWSANPEAWAWFDIPLDGKFQAVQTSMIYFEKGAKAKKIFDKAREKFDFPRKWLTYHWGNAIPDELIVSGAAAHFQIDIAAKSKYIFFGQKVLKDTRDKIAKRFCILSMYGNGNLVKRTYQMWYDTLTKGYSKYSYSRHDFMSHKHA